MKLLEIIDSLDLDTKLTDPTGEVFDAANLADSIREAIACDEANGIANEYIHAENAIWRIADGYRVSIPTFRIWRA